MKLLSTLVTLLGITLFFAGCTKTEPAAKPKKDAPAGGGAAAPADPAKADDAAKTADPAKADDAAKTAEPAKADDAKKDDKKPATP